MCRCDVSWRKPWLWVVAFGILFATAILTRADDLAPGLKSGDDLPGTLRPWTFTGKHLDTLRKRILATIRDADPDPIKQLKRDLAKDLAGEFHCPVSELGLNPVVLIFVKGTEPTPALLQLLQKLDETVVKRERDRLGCAVVFLENDIKDVSKDDDNRFKYAAALEPKLNPFKNITAGLDGYEELQKQFKLNDKADVSAIMYDRLKVTGVRGYLKDGLDDKATEEILKDIEALIAVSKAAANVAPMK